MIAHQIRCIVCGATLVGEREAVRCGPCQAANRWPVHSEAAILARYIVAVPPHRTRPGFREVPA